MSATKYILNPGDKFGRLTVTRTGLTLPLKNGRHDRAAEVECECGTIKIVRLVNLIYGTTKSCGCLAAKYTVNAGDRFGRLVVTQTGLAVRNKNGYCDRMVMARCDCGTERVFRPANLVSGGTRSCGCLARETRRERLNELHVTDPPLPTEIPGVKPSTRGILEILADAGDEGILAADIVRRFGDPAGRAARNRRVNIFINHLRVSGRARRSEAAEHSPYYLGTPTLRWWITDAGREDLSQPQWGTREASREAQKQEAREQRREQRDAALKQAAAEGFGPWTARGERRAKMTELRAAGCSLAEIGGLFGTSWQRVGQLTD